MPRNTRKKIEFTEDSSKDLLQEIYNETCDLKAKAIAAYNKQFVQAEDVSEIAMIGKITTEYLKIAEQALEKKLSVARMLKEIVFKDKANVDNGSGKAIKLTEDDKKAFYSAVKEYQNKNNVEFDFKDKSSKKND